MLRTSSSISIEKYHWTLNSYFVFHLNFIIMKSHVIVLIWKLLPWRIFITNTYEDNWFFRINKLIKNITMQWIDWKLIEMKILHHFTISTAFHVLHTLPWRRFNIFRHFNKGVDANVWCWWTSFPFFPCEYVCDLVVWLRGLLEPTKVM